MTTINRLLKPSVMLGGVSLLLFGAAFAPSAAATELEPIPRQFPDCFGEYMPGTPTLGGGMIGHGNVIYVQPGDGFTFGTSGDDVIIGTDDGEFINGMEGNDRICAGGGADEILGGDGEFVDHIDGEAGWEVLIDGGPGNDVLHGGAGNDYIYDEDGNDAVYGERGDDYILCAGGTDYAEGGLGTDGPASSHGCETYSDAE